MPTNSTGQQGVPRPLSANVSASLFFSDGLTIWEPIGNESANEVIKCHSPETPLAEVIFRFVTVVAGLAGLARVAVFRSGLLVSHVQSPPRRNRDNVDRLTAISVAYLYWKLTRVSDKFRRIFSEIIELRS